MDREVGEKSWGGGRGEERVDVQYARIKRERLDKGKKEREDGSKKVREGLGERK